MNKERKPCAKCGKLLRRINTKGVCSPATPCGRKNASALAPKPTAPAEPKTPTTRTKRGKPPPGPVEEFFELASALGLDPQKLLDGHCRKWVEKTRARALGRDAASPNGVPTLEAQLSNGARTEVAES